MLTHRCIDISSSCKNHCRSLQPLHLPTAAAWQHRAVPSPFVSRFSAAQSPAACSPTPASQASSSSSSSATARRQLLQNAALLLPLLLPSSSRAENDLESQLPAALPPTDYPTAYVRTMNRLLDALEESIKAEANGAKENEVRRKADPAKELVKQFVSRWRDAPEVVGDITHEEMKAALSELGQFYMRSGSRSRLTPEVREGVLQHLAAVRAALPQEPKSLLGL